MIKSRLSDKKFYYIQCGDWECSTVASSPREACKFAASQAIDFFGEDTKFSNVIICSDCEGSLDSNEIKVEAFIVESILEEIHEY
jgi:hypothetical protein